MKINAVISKDIFIKDSVKKNKIHFINFLTIAAAVICGSLIYIFTKNFLADEIISMFSDFFTDFSNKTKTEVFSGILLSHFPYIILMIILGTSAYGYGLILIISFIKVAGLGILSSYFYSSFALEGIEYALLVFFPGKFILILSILFTMHFCINNSIYIRQLIKGECRAENLSSLYTLKTVTAVLLFILSSVVDCFTAVSFTSLFTF